ncbi:helix-turn-helix transcriptional regulator [Clostridium sp.]|uniref:helix-turn-helix domain-containing protein n=1 Tax=Clostridium sp. TaxID=1506 RepID=UPI0025C61440|nr:helix-turn-helix transcriptional regulator [Clostridium sp.]
MIRCNLSILLAERNLRITKVSKDTGISRTTLTSLSSNKAQGIQFDTINTLCNYLKVGPELLISHIPIDIKIVSARIDYDDMLFIDIEITKNSRTFRCELTGDCYVYFLDEKISDLEIYVTLFDEESNDNDEDLIRENSLLINTFNSLPVSFLNDLEDRITDEIISNLDKEVCSPFNCSFTWDDRLLAK